jgi:hypothetical protein
LVAESHRLKIAFALRERVGRHQVLAAFGLYLVASLLLFGRPLVDDPTHSCLCIGTDEGIFAWGLEWWPHALLHGLNPFHPDIIYAPQGINIAQGTLMPGLALVAAPLTAIAGPLLTFNIVALLAPPLAALFAFLLCRRLTGAFWPSLVGGWLFGFSSYVLGEEMGHLHLTVIFLIPALVHLVLRAHAGELSNRRFVVLLTLGLIGQFLLSTEVFATFTVFAAVTLAVAALIGGPRTRESLRALLGPIAISYLATAVIMSPYLYYVLAPGGSPVDLSRAEMFSNDLLGFVVPSAPARIGGSQFSSISQRFTGGFIEANAYLGLPLLILLVWSVRAGWRRLEVRLMAAVLVIVAICSLGARLHVDGHRTIPLPWDPFQRLPLLGVALPARFNMYIALIAAMLAAIVLARRRRFASVLAVLAIASLWPATERSLWHSNPDLPHLFTTDAWRGVLHPHDRVLALPIGILGNSMLWQAETRLGFTMASGYAVAPEATDPYKRYPIYPTLTYGQHVAHEQRAAAQFLASQHVTVVVMSAVGSAITAPWLTILPRLGWRSIQVAGAIVFRPAGAAPSAGLLTPAPGTPPPSSPPSAATRSPPPARAHDG